MHRILVIDQDRTAMEKLGLACLEQGLGVVMADNVCEGVRVLVEEDVLVALVDEHALRFGPRESATLFDRVAPGVPVVVMIRPQTELGRVVALELAGFHVVTKPVAVADLLAKTVTHAETKRR